jgi:hypothetical protein
MTSCCRSALLFKGLYCAVNAIPDPDKGKLLHISRPTTDNLCSIASEDVTYCSRPHRLVPEHAAQIGPGSRRRRRRRRRRRQRTTQRLTGVCCSFSHSHVGCFERRISWPCGHGVEANPRGVELGHVGHFFEQLPNPAVYLFWTRVQAAGCHASPISALACSGC